MAIFTNNVKIIFEVSSPVQLFIDWFEANKDQLSSSVNDAMGRAVSDFDFEKIIKERLHEAVEEEFSRILRFDGSTLIRKIIRKEISNKIFERLVEVDKIINEKMPIKKKTLRKR